jgi:hypothetical protein
MMICVIDRSLSIRNLKMLFCWNMFNCIHIQNMSQKGNQVWDVGSWSLVIRNLEPCIFVWWTLIREGNPTPWVLSSWVKLIKNYANLTRTYKDTRGISWNSNESCKVLSNINILRMLEDFNSS